MLSLVYLYSVAIIIGQLNLDKDITWINGSYLN